MKATRRIPICSGVMVGMMIGSAAVTVADATSFSPLNWRLFRAVRIGSIAPRTQSKVQHRPAFDIGLAQNGPTAQQGVSPSKQYCARRC